MELKKGEIKIFYEGKSNPVLEIKIEAVLREFGYEWDDIGYQDQSLGGEAWSWL